MLDKQLRKEILTEVQKLIDMNIGYFMLQQKEDQLIEEKSGSYELQEHQRAMLEHKLGILNFIEGIEDEETK